MNEQEIKALWKTADVPSIELRLKHDMDNFEKRYRFLLRNTNLLYDRKFQIGLTIFLTLLSISLLFTEARVWYSDILCAIVITLWWYVFYLTDRLRLVIKAIRQDMPIVEQMRRRKGVLDHLSHLRMVQLISAALMFILIWSFRSPERRSEGTVIFGFVAVFSMVIGAMIITRRKLASTRHYLSNIVKIMEQEN